MSKKNRKALAEAAATLETTPTQVAEVVETPAETTTPEVTESATPAPAAAPARCFWVNTERPFRPRKGFETVLYNALAEPRSAAEVAAALLASGEYHKVAPKAAELRTLKPVKFLLKTWFAAGILKATA